MIWTTSQLQDLLRHRRVNKKATAPKLIDSEKVTPDTIEESLDVRVCDVLYFSITGRLLPWWFCDMKQLFRDDSP
jgi:hypothetical protein